MLEQKEFSLEGFSALCGLKWSQERLAVNGKRYRKAAPTNEFWDQWDKDSEYLRKHGISVYEEYSEKGVFDWSPKGKGTKEEYQEQQKLREAEMLKEAKLTLKAGMLEEDFDADIAKIDGCTDLTELKKFAEGVVFGEQMIDLTLSDYSLK